MTTRSMTMMLTASLLALAALTGCGSQTITYSTSETEYSAQTLTAVIASTDTGSLPDTPVSEADDLRSRALVELRGEGAEQAQVADLITATFTGPTTAVPVRVERATFAGQPAIIVVEAIGPEGGMLADKRVWVLSTDGSVLYSGMD